MQLEVIEVIRTVNTEGRGEPDDPYRCVTRYWLKDGEMIVKKDPLEELLRQENKTPEARP